MPTKGQAVVDREENSLGAFLKDRRARLDPVAFGFSSLRRRTPGLRREEVAQRADVSATWYTWLEQGRGGVPSADTLDRIAQALDLNALEREHLFLLAQHRPPEVQYQAPEGVASGLQRVLDALELCPAYIRTAVWDVVAWNRAASAVLGDFGAAPPQERNILRRLFSNRQLRTEIPNWEASARLMVAVFRADVVRARASTQVAKLVDELSRSSPEFAALWRDQDVRTFGTGTKHLWHPLAGSIGVEYSSFAVDGRPDLNMVVFTPTTSADSERVRALVERPLFEPFCQNRP